jgi:hypothetical protein
VGALANNKVAELVNEHFIATYLKVGTFRIVNGQKQGGNVASYFCLPDGSVLHAVPGPVNSQKFLNEARWALETRKSALTLSTRLATGEVDQGRYHALVRHAHEERFAAEQNPWMPPGRGKNAHQNVTRQFPANASQQGQVHWLLANDTLAPIDVIYPIVWEQILREQLSGLPVAQR